MILLSCHFSHKTSCFLLGFCESLCLLFWTIVDEIIEPGFDTQHSREGANILAVPVADFWRENMALLSQ